MSAVRKKTTGSLAGFPVQVVPKHSQYSLRVARPASMPLCWVVPYSRLKACESWGLRFWCEAPSVMGPYLESPSAQLSEFGGSESSERERSRWRLGVSCCEFRIHRCSRLCVCSGSVGLGAESQRALVGRLATGRLSGSVQPGTSVCRKVSHPSRPQASSYLVPKTANVVIISERREPVQEEENQQ
jgi:hypothetical protein